MAGRPVLLISMPFGPLRTPSIGLGLLSAQLSRLNIANATKYFNLGFADLVGDGMYLYYCDGYPATHALLAEWLFNDALNEAECNDGSDYLQEVLEPLLSKRSFPPDFPHCRQQK